MNEQIIQDYKKAGQIAKQVREWILPQIKTGDLLLELAEKIEDKIISLGGKPAFPCTLSINEVAAHSTPLPGSKETAHGLIKVDFGVHINGHIADQSTTLDLDNSPENQKLIEASQLALKEALELTKLNTPINEIGKVIESSTIKSGFKVIRNLSGHSLQKNIIHAGITIPNYDNNNSSELEEGAYAIEPFVTTGSGAVRDGKPSSIFSIEKQGNVRDPTARKVLNFILEEYETLPFCTRWIEKKFGSRAALALRQIEQAGILHQYPQLIERSGKPVAQSEHTVLLTNSEKTIITN